MQQTPPLPLPTIHNNHNNTPHRTQWPIQYIPEVTNLANFFAENYITNEYRPGSLLDPPAFPHPTPPPHICQGSVHIFLLPVVAG